MSGGQSCPAYSGLPRPFGVKASSCHLEALPLAEVRCCMSHCEVPLRDAVRDLHHDDGLLPDGVRYLHHCDVLLPDGVGCCMSHRDVPPRDVLQCLHHSDVLLLHAVSCCLLCLDGLPLVRMRWQLRHSDPPLCDVAPVHCV